MATPANDRARLRFSIFEVDLAAGELRRRGVRINLQEKPFQILALLLERSGEVVTREELQSRLWPDGTFVDFDKGLNTAIKKLRQALGDSAGTPVFIETIPRRGYRFVASAYPDPASVPSPAPHGSQGEFAAASSGRTASRGGNVASGPGRWLPGRAPAQFYLYAALALLIVGATAGEVWRRVSQAGTFSPENLPITPLTRSGKVRQMAISPDGKFAVIATQDGIRQGLLVHDIQTNNEMQLLAPDTVNFPGIEVSPDSRFVYFSRSEKTNPYFGCLYRMPVSGGPVEQLIRDADSTVSFSPDGRQLVYTRGIPDRNLLEVRIADADGSGDHLLKSLNGHQAFEAGATWSPKGDVVVVPVHTVDPQSRFALLAISLRDGRTVQLLSSAGSIGRPLWLPSGRELLVAFEDEDSHRQQLWTVSYPGGRRRRLTNDLSDYSSSIDLTADGSTLATIVTDTASDLWTVPVADPSHPVQLTSGEPSLFQVHELSDGRLLVLGEELWSMNANGTDRVRLGGIPDASRIELCGESIVAVARKDGDSILMRMEKDGTKPRAIVSGDVHSPSCSADGRNIYFSNFAAPQKIHRVPAESGSPADIADVQGNTLSGSLVVSPDGSLLAYPYQQYSPPLLAIAVIPSAGGPVVNDFLVPGPIGRLRWSPDGKAVDYLLTQNGATNIWEQHIGGGSARQITSFSVGQIFDFSWSRDGKNILMSRGHDTRDVALIRDSRHR